VLRRAAWPAVRAAPSRNTYAVRRAAIRNLRVAQTAGVLREHRGGKTMRDGG